MSDTFRIDKPTYDAATGVARFPYALGDLRFTETLQFPAGGDADAAASSAPSPSCSTSPRSCSASATSSSRAPLRIAADFPLTAAERDFALDVYSNGLGEFYARNNLNHFGKIEIDAPPTTAARPAPRRCSRTAPCCRSAAARTRWSRSSCSKPPASTTRRSRSTPRARSSARSTRSVERRSTSPARSIPR